LSLEEKFKEENKDYGYRVQLMQHAD
jgi:hypothetical protein